MSWHGYCFDLIIIDDNTGGCMLKGNQDTNVIETIDKLRQFGLSDEQIAEALNIPLEQVKQVDLEL